MENLGVITTDIKKNIYFNLFIIKTFCSTIFLDYLFPIDIINFIFKLYYNLIDIKLFSFEYGKRFNILIDYHLYECKFSKEKYFGRSDVSKIYKNDKKIQFYSSDGKNSFILTNEGLFGKGENRYGQLGLGEFGSVDDFKKIYINFSVKSISITKFFTYIQTKEDYLYSCGTNHYYLLLNKFKESPNFNSCYFDNTNYKVIQYSCATDHSLILTKETLYGFGSNDYFQLGKFTRNDRYNGHYYINQVFNINKIISFQCNTRCSFILMTDGLYSTGQNTYGQLGHGTCSNIYNFTFIKNLNDILSFNIFPNNSLVLTKNGLYGCGSIFIFNINYTIFTKIDIQNIISYNCTIMDLIIINDQGFYRSDNRYYESLETKQKLELIKIKF